MRMANCFLKMFENHYIGTSQHFISCNGGCEDVQTTFVLIFLSVFFYVCLNL